jgi:Flp pilus assembly pilin Flp
MLNPIKRFVLDESGLETIEWAMVGSVIAVTAAALFFAIGTDALRGLTPLGVETSKIP